MAAHRVRRPPEVVAGSGVVAASGAGTSALFPRFYCPTAISGDDDSSTLMRMSSFTDPLFTFVGAIVPNNRIRKSLPYRTQVGPLHKI